MSIKRKIISIHKTMPTLIPGLVLFLIIAVPAAAGRYFLDPGLLDLNGSRINLPPSPSFLLGTQSEGRDMFSLILTGTWATLKIGLIAGGLGVFFGIILGMTAAYFGGKPDAIIRSIVDIGLTIPQLAILILVAASIRILSTTGMGLIIAITAWMQPTRVIRSQVLAFKEKNFVQMAKISSLSGMEIVFFEILPNLLPFLAASFVNSVSTAILSSIGLEVLGLGSQKSLSLGMTIYYSIYYSAMWKGLWWWWLPPVVVIIFIFISLFLISLAFDSLKGS
jgi:peptide/nickel transport system permease protein